MNGKYELLARVKAGAITILSLIVAISIALLIIINVSPLLITFPSQLGLTNAAILKDYGRIIAYLQLPSIQQLQLASLPISPTALHHFRDVKRLFLLNEGIMLIATPLLIWELRRQKRQNQLWRLILPFQMMFILLVFGSFMAWTNFDSYFIQFHYLFFNNMDWVFEPQIDPIILLMPASFFNRLFVWWVIVAGCLLGLVWVWLKWSLRVFFRKS